MDEMQKNNEQFYKLQKNASAWMAETFITYVCNWQEHCTGNKVIENFYCVTKTKRVLTIVIVYDIGKDNYFTYEHQTNYP